MIPPRKICKAICKNAYLVKCVCYESGGCRLPDIAPIAKCPDLVRIPEDIWEKAQKEFENIQRRIYG